MRILMLSWEYPPHVVGGIGTHVSSLVPALSDRGVHVTLITPRWSGGETVSQIGENIVVHRVDPPIAPTGNFFADAREANANLSEFANSVWQSNGKLDGQGRAPFDLIHAHDWLVAFAADSLKTQFKTPLVATIHATERGRGRGNLLSEMSVSIDKTEWSLAYAAWRVITVSRYMAEEVKTFLKVPPDKIDVVPNGVDTDLFDRLDDLDLAHFRAEWADPHQPLVFFVGRLQYEKGAQVLVEAAPRVLAEFPHCKIVLAGSGPMVESLKRRVEALAISDHVAFPGFVSDEQRNRLFKVADAAVFPSLYEPFGIVALEAMAACCPVVASDVGGLSEVITSRETGLLVPPDNSESLAGAILETLRNPDLARQRAAAAHRLAHAEYSWDRIAERTIEVYDRVLGERAGVTWQ